MVETYGSPTLAQMRESATNSIELATNILEDSELYYVAMATKLLAGPGRAAYLDILHQHSLGPMSTARWLARRAGGGWMEACRACADMCQSPELECTLGLQAGVWPEDVRLARAENFMCMMVEIIAHRAWQQVERSTVLPDLLFAFFETSPEKVDAGLAKARKVWETILHAIRVRQSGYAGRTKVKAVLDDCYFAENALVKDLMLLLQRTGHRSRMINL